jgi:hypothetical protein
MYSVSAVPCQPLTSLDLKELLDKWGGLAPHSQTVLIREIAQTNPTIRGVQSRYQRALPA